MLRKREGERETEQESLLRDKSSDTDTDSFDVSDSYVLFYVVRK